MATPAGEWSQAGVKEGTMGTRRRKLLLVIVRLGPFRVKFALIM